MAETQPPAPAAASAPPAERSIRFVSYQSEAQMPDIMQMIQKDLSEPYTVYTFRYFINNWSRLCFLAYDNDSGQCVGAIVCKLDARDKRDSPDQHQATPPAAPAHQQHQGRPESPAGQQAAHIAYTGYIAMLVVQREYRKARIGSQLVLLAVNAMKESHADEIVLETEVTNKPALRLYENFGFLRDRRLAGYYLNGLDAFRLKLWLV